MVYIKGYGSVNSAGEGVDSFWSSLTKGKDNSRPVNIKQWPDSVSKYLELNEIKQPKFCQFNDSEKFLTAFDTILDKLTKAYDEAIASCEKDVTSNKLGIIFSSTKGYTEDIIWSTDLGKKSTQNTYTRILDAFCAKKGLLPIRKLCISNACTSSHAAIYTANKWINNNIADHVIIIAADIIGPFIYSGFTSLRSLCSTKTKPFDRDRDGLQLGDGAAALILSKERPEDKKCLYIAGIELDSEGFAITKPSIDGNSLLKTCERVLASTNKVPSIVIAHGTGTITNDIIEDTVVSSLFNGNSSKPFVTGTKWCIGHTLGASGCMDLIAACSILSKQLCFSIANTDNIDPIMKANYLVGNELIEPEQHISNILVNSLGFGGYHASMMVCIGDQF